MVVIGSGCSREVEQAKRIQYSKMFLLADFAAMSRMWPIDCTLFLDALFTDHDLERSYFS